MPEESNSQPQNQNPPTVTTKPTRKKFIIVLVSVVVLVSVIGAALLYFGIFKKSSGESSTSQKKDDVVKVARVFGKSDGELPYAPIDKENVVSGSFGKSGGVLQTTLSKGVEAYFVLPEGAVIMDASISLLPYKEMPTQKSHGGLSGDYGYGVQVSIKSVQMGLGGYLVFDTTGGEATQEAAKKAKFINRCDPRFKWFNPFVCARKNKVPVEEVVDKNVTVVTPIHTEKYNDLVFTDNTIPIGIDGLIVSRVEKGDVYIPQKLDKDLVQELANKTLGKYMNDAERLEAAAQALEWGIDLDNEQRVIVADAIGETYQEIIKALYIYREYSNQVDEELSRAEARSVNNEDEEDERETEIEDLEDLISLFFESEEDTRTNFVSDARYDTQDYDGEVSLDAAAGLGAAAEMGIDGASDAASEAGSSLGDQAASETGVVDALGELEGAQLTGDEAAAEQAQEKVEKTARDMINDTINDPNSSITDLLNAAALAQMLGLDDLADQCFDKIKEKLEDMLKEDLSKEEALNAAALCQMLGFDSLADKFLEKSKTAKSVDCDVVNKTLETYGINTCE